MAALTMVLCLFTVGHVLWTFWPSSAPAPQGVCAAPVEVHENGVDRLGCADESALQACRAAALDRVELFSDGSPCRRHPEGMRPEWRILTAHKLDINRATAEALERVPDLGPHLAQAIVTERETHGPFTAMDDLMRVPGIGPLRAKRLAAWLGGVPPAPR